MHLRLLYKKFLCVFMSLMIVIFSTQSAYATTSVGGWTALDTITAGATNTINAAKGAGASAVRSAVTVAPSAVKVGKNLIKGGGYLAVALAVSQLVGDSVDWVLDPANNSVKYIIPTNPDDIPTQYLYGATTILGDERFKTRRLTADAFCSRLHSNLKYFDDASGGTIECYSSSGVIEWRGKIVRYPNPAYGSQIPEKEESIPISDIAAQVISNAEAGHGASQEAVKAAALEGFAAGEHDAALDAAAQPSTGTENPPDAGTENPPVDTPTDPTKPFDPSSILSALGSIASVLAGIMSALTGFVDWWQAQWATFSAATTGFFEWVRAEPDTASLQPEPVEVSEGTLVDGWQDKANAGYVNLGSTQCPSDVLIPISYMGASTNLSISYVPFCHFASIIRYAVIMGAWIAALMIISGGRTKE